MEMLTNLLCLPGGHIGHDLAGEAATCHRQDTGVAARSQASTTADAPPPAGASVAAAGTPPPRSRLRGAGNGLLRRRRVLPVCGERIRAAHGRGAAPLEAILL